MCLFVIITQIVRHNFWTAKKQERTNEILITDDDTINLFLSAFCFCMFLYSLIKPIAVLVTLYNKVR